MQYKKGVFYFTFYLVFILVLLVSCDQGNKKSNIDITARLDSLFETDFKKNEPGAAVLIARDGKVIYQHGFGLADINTKETINTQTLFNLGSISKTFVAYGILQLAKENKLSLDDDLHKYFPDFTDPVIAKSIKLHHLLTHTSGLPDIRNVLADSIFYLTAKDEENWAPEKKTTQLEFQPGERFNYSNPAFNGLALIIEKVSGMKWQDYIQKKIMGPAGMKTSTITDGAHPDKGVAHGYLFDGTNFSEKDYGEEPTFAASGNGGVWSSVEELWKYERAIQEYIFLVSAWIKKSRTVYNYENWNDSIPAFLGLSWFITEFEKEKMIGHTGSQGGFRSDYVWLPDKNFYYVILCNTPKPLTELRKAVFNITNP